MSAAGWKPAPPPPPASNAINWEEYYSRESAARVWNEVRAYSRLESLQDVAVPRLYGAGTLELALRAVAPPVLLLQHIADVRSLEERSTQALLSSRSRFTMLGVVHNGLNGSEILGFPASRPIHAFIIYFAHAIVR